MKHWISYLENEEGKEVIYHDYGLIAYKVIGTELMITDFFIDPETRSKGLALTLSQEAEKFARRQKCVVMSCNVYINEKNKGMFPRKIALFTEFGFEVLEANNNIITMIKRLGE
jgi:GNAT superfamily N-acetyltransferase